MPALGLSATIRKASEAGRRLAALARARPAMVTPRAHYEAKAHDAVLILQRGDNPSTDYYLRPRLEAERVPTAIVDVSSDPAGCALLARAEAPLVIVCRYISKRWLKALEARGGRFARLVFFADDDLAGMMADRALPLSVRGKVARHYGLHARRLGALCSEVWLSTPALAERYPEARAVVLTPVPEAGYRPAQAEVRPLVVYHSTDVHGAERGFIAEVAARLASLAPEAVVEMTGDAALRRRCGANVRIVAQTAWPRYRDEQAHRIAALSLAPLTPSAVNAGRAPVKAFDAARLGAAGLYADAEPYRGFIRDRTDGLLLPMQAEAWAAAIADLLRDPARRLKLARAGQARMAKLRREAGGFPPAAPS